MREADLYPPVKALLTAQGSDVKGEVGDCDVVAIRGAEPPVIVELKASFSLALVLQGVARQTLSDNVYLAVPPLPKRGHGARLKEILGLCRRLGLGLMTVRTAPPTTVEVLLDPAPYRPRQNAPRRARLLREHAHRVGDPECGGTAKRRPAMTAYRQDALRCARHLSREGPTKAAAVAAATGVPKAALMLRRDVYGWFERVERGIYRLSPRGGAALDEFADALAALSD